MIVAGWLLAAALAEPLGAGSPEFDRLLGPVAPVETPAEAASSSSPSSPSSPSLPWPVGVGALALAALWFGRGRFKLPGVASDAELRIVGRQALGGRAGLAVVEVRAAEGAWRRLVVGLGEGGPKLVADLGVTAFDEVMDEVVPTAEPESEPPEEPGKKLISEVLGERRRRKVRSTITTTV